MADLSAECYRLSDSDNIIAMQKHDPALDTLLDLDGVTLVVDPDRGFWVRFVVNCVAPTPGKPHGLDYSLTLHDKNGERLVGFDNVLTREGLVGKKKRFLSIPYGMAMTVTPSGFHMQGRSDRP